MKNLLSRGMSLIEICIAILLLGIATSAVFAMMRLVNNTLGAERLRSDVQELRRNLLERVSCSNTLNPAGATPIAMPPAGCSNLQLKDAAKNVIIANGAKFKGLEVTYSCWSSTGGTVDQILVQYRATNESLSKVYGANRDLFAGIKPFCYSYFQGGSISSGGSVPVYMSCGARPTPVLTPDPAPCSQIPIGNLAPL